MDQNEWMPQQGPSTTLTEMDELIVNLRKAKDEREAAEKVSTEAYHRLEEAKKAVINALKSNGRSKFEVEGIGLAYISTKEVYETPKSNDEKLALYGYIKDKYGETALTTMLGINHNTLNSWANKETEADPTLRIPGLKDPTSMETLNFRAK